MKQFLSFAGVGLLSTVLDILVLKLLLMVGVNLYVATAAGFMVGLTNGYLLNSRYVFGTDHTPARYTKYFIISFGGLVWTELIIALLSGETGLISPLLAKLVAVVLVFFWNYGLSKVWAFK